MKFFRTIRSSLYDPSFYREMRGAGAAQAVKQFALLIFFISLATAVFLGATFFAWVSTTSDLQAWRETALSLYPDELVLEYRDGHVSSNVEEPYAIPLPEQLMENSGAAEKAGKPMPNLLVISTRHPVSLDDFGRYDTAAILAEDSIWINNVRDGKIEVQKFDDRNRMSFTVDKERAARYVDKAFSILKPVAIAFFVLLPFLIFAALMAGYLVYLIFGACVVWVVAKIRNTDLTYGQSYKLGLYLMTAPVLFGLLSTTFLHIEIPFLFTLILAAVAYANLAPAKKEDVPSAPQASGESDDPDASTPAVADSVEPAAPETEGNKIPS